MASELSDYFANAILNYVRGTAMPAAPGTVYVGLFDGDPKAGGTEVTTTISAGGRVAVPWTAVAARAIENNADIDFGAAAGAADVDHFALFTAASAGNQLGSTPLDNARSIGAGDPVVFPAGSLEMNFN